MIIFQNSYLKKSTALILSICMISLIAGPVLFYPKKAQALCPVSVATSVPEEKQSALQIGWRAIQKAYESGALGEAITTVAELVAANAGEIAKWAASVLLNMMIHQLLTELTNDIVNWIENGQKPRFMTEGFGGYLEDAIDNVAGNFIDQYLGLGLLCQSFDLDIKIALLDVPTFDAKAQCTFSQMIGNLDNFYQDFSQGGWKGWIELSKPQNNFYGSLLMAQDEKTKVINDTMRNIEADSDEGWLPARNCIWYDARRTVVQRITDVRGIPPLPSACKGDWQTSGVVKPCALQCETWTPANTINKTVNKTVNNWMDQMNAAIAGATAKAGPYQVYLQAVINALMNRIMKEGMGLLKADPQTKPNFGDVGASAGIPQTISPQDAEQNKVDATALDVQLAALDNNINNQLLNEQQTNLAVMRSIGPAYQGAFPDLDLVINACTNVPPYASYITWAQGKKNEINNTIIPRYNSMINTMETVDIPDTIALINDTRSTSVLAQELVNKANNWLTVYQQTGGRATTTAMQTATTEMNTAKNNLITATQALITDINGAVSSTDLGGLTTETLNSNSTIVTLAQNLMTARGNPTFPDPGTLYAEIEAAAQLKADAQSREDTCNAWVPPITR